jgi:DNA repair protein RadC
MTTLYIQEESGFRKASDDDVITSAQGLISKRFRRGSPVLSSPGRMREFLSIHLGACESEIFGIIHLDNRYRSLGAEDLFRGTIDGAAVYPRVIIKSVLARNSAAAVCYHNHPSGNSQSSHADEAITIRIRDALSLIDVRLIDHLIIGENIFSFAEAGLL